MDRALLLYVLDMVKAGCRREFGIFRTCRTSDADEEVHRACVQLEQDGLIELHSEEDGHFLWKLR